MSLAGVVNNTANSAALAFVRSFNILLKYSRLYGPEHARTASQFESTWKELAEAQSQSVATGLMLGAAENQLLLDGKPLGPGTAERSLAQLMKTAGVASIYFSPATSPEDFRKLMQAFVSSGKSSSAFAEAWKPMAGGAIRLNQVRFVAHDGEGESFSLASHLASQALAEHAPEMQAWLRDPHKLLQMIAAAEGASRVTGTFVAPGMQAAPQAGTPVPSPEPIAPAQESDMMEVIRMLTQWGGQQPGAGGEKISGSVSELPAAAQHALRHALQEVAELSHSDPSKPLLLQVAEHLAIRFALDRFERGEVRVNAVREMLGRMGRELESLRSVLSAHEDKMSRAGLDVENHADILDRQFWASMPEKGKRSVLLSADAWCIPPRNVEQYVRELMERGESSLAERILATYAEGIATSDPEGRSKSATGLCHLAELYASFPQLLQQVLQKLGEQLTKESDPEMQRAFSAAFVRLSNEAVGRRDFSSVQQAIVAVDAIEKQLPELALQLRPRLGLHDRLPQFVSEAIACNQPAPELLEMLRCVPQAASQKLVAQFEACARRECCERIVSVMEQLGPAAAQHLRDQLRTQPAPEAAVTVGLLSRLDARALDHVLPQRISSWPRAHQDVAIRQLAAGAAPGRGHLLLKLMDHVDAALLPEVVDEIGMAGERSSTARLMSLAFDDEAGDNGAFLRVKAIEALGRLHEGKAGDHLRMLVAARHLLHWKHPREIRVASAHALAMIDPQTAEGFLAGKGFTPRELALGPLSPLAAAPWMRQRRYPRVLPPQEVSGTVSSAKRSAHLQVKRLSLGGGLAQVDGTATSGSPADLELQAGLSHIRAQVWLRSDGLQPHNVSFEIIGIDLEERSKLRRLLAGESWSLLPGHLLQMQIPSSLRAAWR